MSTLAPSGRAVQIAVALEVAWAILLAYVTHHDADQNWRLLVVNFVDGWAHAAVAIVVVTWLADVALAQHRRRPSRS